MATSDSIESMVVLDCGSTMTRAVLIDLVDGHYRFIARGETFNLKGNSGGDFLISVREAIRQIENITGRTLLNEEHEFIKPDRADGHGADALLIVANVAAPLRVILAGLSDQVSLASARRAVHATHALIEHVICPPRRSDQGAKASIESKMDFIATARPEVIVLTGGIDGGPAAPVEDLATWITLGCSLIEDSPKPQVVYAGNAAIREQIAGIIGDTAPLVMVDNVRPNLDIENIESLNAVLDEFYRQKMFSELPGFQTVAGWSEAKVLTGLQAMSYARIRKIDSDFERVARQQRVIEAIYHKVTALDTGTLMDLVFAHMGDVKTDISAAEALKLISQAKGLDIAQVRTLRIPIDGAYSAKMIRGASFIVPGMKRNLNALHAFLAP